MIVWLSATNGAGQTPSRALVQQPIPDSRVFDAEKAGGHSWTSSQDCPPDYFQHWPPWRPLVVETARRILDYTNGTLVMPMYAEAPRPRSSTPRTSPPLPQGDMSGSYPKPSITSSMRLDAPKCNRRSIPSATPRDAPWLMRVPNRVALASVASRAGRPRPIAQGLLGS